MEQNELQTNTTATTAEVVQPEAAQSHELKHEVTLYAEPITHVGTFSITNSLLTSWTAVLIIVLLSVVVRLRMKRIPTKLQHFFEVIIEGGLSMADQVTGNRKASEKVFPIAISIFFFVLINNWLGILPLMSLGIAEHGSFLPFLRSGTADINTTLALAVMSVIGANLFGIFSIGAWKMLNKYVNLKALAGIVTKIRKEPTVLIVAPITFFVGLIEIVGEAAKIASLSFRLFGNVFAGEVLLASMGALFAYALPIPFLFLEVIVGIIQAFIFSMLTVVYFTIASSDHDEHEHEDAHSHSHSASTIEDKVAISH
jgi:F-type H+-transporting ATPase subunit a